MTRDKRTTSKNWVWISSNSSLINSQTSILALVEVPLSVMVYFFLIPQVFGTFFPAILSAACLPFVLLKSEESVTLAIEKWERYIHSKGEGCEIIALIVASSISLLLMLLLKSIFVKYHLEINDVDQDAIISIHLVTGALVVIINYTVSGIFSIYSSFMGKITTLSSLVSILLYAVISQFIEFEFLSVTIIAAGMLCGVFIMVIGFFGSSVSHILGNGGFFSLLLVGPMFFTIGLSGFSAFLRSLIIRLISILSNFQLGLLNITRNWLYIIECEDIKTSPEIIPGVRRFRATIKSEHDADRLADINSATMTIGNPISVLWRYAIKSTFWIYGPIIMLNPPGVLNDFDYRVKWIKMKTSLIEDQIYLYFGLISALIVSSNYASIFELFAIDKLLLLFTFDEDNISSIVNTFVSKEWQFLCVLIFFISTVIRILRGFLRVRFDANFNPILFENLVSMLITISRVQIIFLSVYWFLLIDWIFAIWSGAQTI